MDDDELIDTFKLAFRGRPDVIGTEDGGCLHLLGVEWHEHIERHLRGEAPCGTYPLLPDGNVTWGCVDFDLGEDESWVHARNVQGVLGELGVAAWVERSRSKGFHVWVLPGSPRVDAWLMRRALLAACQLVDAPTKEINPKQTDPANGIGNYVRLPYPGALETGYTADGRRMFVNLNRDVLVPLHDFIQVWEHHAFVDGERRATAASLLPVSELYRAPDPIVPKGVRKWEQIKHDEPAVRRMNGRAYVVWRDGPAEGSDRSTALWRLCCYLGEPDSKVTFEEAVQIVNDLAERIDKFDAHRRWAECERMVRKAWGE